MSDARRLLAPLCILASLGALMAVVVTIVLNHFYDESGMYDIALFSVAIWRSGPRLIVPDAFSQAGSFLRVHLMWFLIFPSLISQWLPLGRIPFFALYIASLHAALALGMMMVLKRLFPDAKPWAWALIAPAGAAFALNANAQSMLSQTHVEIAGPAFALLFFAALCAGRNGWAMVWMGGALLVREDMGFHLSAPLFLTLALDRLRGVRPPAQRLWWYFCGFALLFSAVMVLMLQVLLGVTGVFQTVYLSGSGGPFSHLTVELMQRRLANLLWNRPWIWLPGALALVWGIRSRNPYLALGHAAYLPWLILALSARDDTTGFLHVHYAYPFIIAGAWPLIAASEGFRRGRVEGHAPPPRRRLAWVAAILLAQQIIVEQGHVYVASWALQFTSTPYISAESRARIDALERALPPLSGTFGAYRADHSALGVMPYTIDRFAALVKSNAYDQERRLWLPYDGGEEGVDTVFYFENTRFIKQVRATIQLNGLDAHYHLPGTRLWFSTRRDVSHEPAVQAHFVASAPPWQ